ncbi:hypothetical protein Tco_0954401 [Tanacetum coccineum]|uniref:Uncharacterized protein n=1 Tax=Tanacetum coccineum TaxID=301880 RepID=A0ABQ5E2P6_9ASTR
MLSNTEKLLEAFIGGLPRSIKGNVTAMKPQTLEEAINIAQRLIDQAYAATLAVKNRWGPFNQELQKQEATHWKIKLPLTLFSHACEKKALYNFSAEEDQQQCPRKSLHAKG